MNTKSSLMNPFLLPVYVHVGGGPALPVTTSPVGAVPVSAVDGEPKLSPPSSAAATAVSANADASGSDVSFLTTHPARIPPSTIAVSARPAVRYVTAPSVVRCGRL